MQSICQINFITFLYFEFYIIRNLNKQKISAGTVSICTKHFKILHLSIPTFFNICNVLLFIQLSLFFVTTAIIQQYRETDYGKEY